VLSIDNFATGRPDNLAPRERLIAVEGSIVDRDLVERLFERAFYSTRRALSVTLVRSSSHRSATLHEWRWSIGKPQVWWVATHI
jgi:hypothetical protein